VSESVNVSVEKQIVADPIGAYQEFHGRLLKEGQNTPFPEFKPVVDHLQGVIEGSRFGEVLKAHPDLRFEREEALTYLGHVNMEFKVDVEDYPYPVPFNAPYPYRPTIDAIEAGVRYLDKMNRLEPGNQAIPLYHFDRYAYHRHGLIADPDVVLFPTIEKTGFFDFIRPRSVPIGILGVETETTRVDRHHQSPLDFWFHDLNHARRMLGYMKRRERELGIETEEGKLDYYKEMDQFIVEKIVPHIEGLPPKATQEEIAMRRMIRVIMFEILHESALTAERDVIVADLIRGAGPQPFELMVNHINDMPEDIEELRTPVGNLKSGISLVRTDDNSPVVVHQIYDRALGLLANVQNKIGFGFYDDPNRPSRFVVPKNFRSPEHTAKAAMQILDIFDMGGVADYDTLLKLANSREGQEELFVYKSMADETGEQVGATDPISADEIIEQVRAKNKYVHTLFGYSRLGYEDEDAVMTNIKEELGQLDSSSTIICIGATEEGIGGAYKIAKELGLPTIGIVSTQALSYSGRFSEQADQIFIVNDPHWGGYVPGTFRLTEATRAFLGVSDSISAYGGGQNTAVALEHARKMDIRVVYHPAEMNHEITRKEAADSDKEIDFRGAAYHLWNQI
jgi:hypothetical protein